MAITACGLFLLAFLLNDTHLAYIIGILILIGIGFALFSSPNSNAIMGAVEKKYLGVASGILSTMRLTGQMFSMGIAMLIFAIYIGSAQITPEYFPAFIAGSKTAFIFFGLLCTAGVFASLSRGKMR